MFIYFFSANIRNYYLTEILSFFLQFTKRKLTAKCNEGKLFFNLSNLTFIIVFKEHSQILLFMSVRNILKYFF